MGRAKRTNPKELMKKFAIGLKRILCANTSKSPNMHKIIKADRDPILKTLSPVTLSSKTLNLLDTGIGLK